MPIVNQPYISDVYVCILAGGSGTRLWPLSRQRTPKQLLNLVGQRSMLQQTIDRVKSLVPIERTLVLTDPEHVELIAEHLPELPRENIYCEPSARGTAPALGLTAFRLRQKLPGNTVMVSLHADHIIKFPDRFRTALLTAIHTAREGYLVTIGVIPHHPETGYGYIERGKLLNNEQPPVYSIATFREKPPLELAREYLASGLYDWNTGYFTWTLDAILKAFEHYQPTIYAQLAAIAQAAGTPDEAAVLANTWEFIERTTIDVGIMEHTTNAAVVTCDLGWSDIGSWASLYEILPHDYDDNVIMGDGDHYELNTHNCLIRSEKRLVVSIGLEDMIIVDTDDALLVLPRDQAQNVSELVKQLKQHNMTDYL